MRHIRSRIQTRTALYHTTLHHSVWYEPAHAQVCSRLNVASLCTGRAKSEVAVLIPFRTTPLFTLHNFCSEQGGLETSVNKVKSAVGSHTVILHYAGSESTHPASPSIPTFTDAF